MKKMESAFDLDYWDHLKPILKNEFPQLTNADLFWRHETKDDLFKMIATKLRKTQKQFEEAIDLDGVQHALYPFNDPGQLPVTPLRQSNGEWLRIKIDLPGYPVWLRVWQVRVGRVNLYLLDSNDAANFPVQVYFYDINPDTLRVELFAEGINGEVPQIANMERGKKTEGTPNGYHFVASVISTRPATDYTPRVIPNLPGVSAPLESTLILWQQ